MRPFFLGPRRNLWVVCHRLGNLRDAMVFMVGCEEASQPTIRPAYKGCGVKCSLRRTASALDPMTVCADWKRNRNPIPKRMGSLGYESIFTSMGCASRLADATHRFCRGGNFLGRLRLFMAGSVRSPTAALWNSVTHRLSLAERQLWRKATGRCGSY